MCGVVGYVGKNLCRNYIMKGLSRLEYRGYDSAGFACLSPQDNHVLYAKAKGQLHNLLTIFEQKPIDGYVGIGHTRWSTHGISSQENAHPHFDCTQKIAVVHNGIIENHHQFRESLLARGHHFQSQTDTEIIAHVLEECLAQDISLPQAFSKVSKQLEGAYSFVCLIEQYPEQMVIVRKGSPLCIGIGHEEMFIASDLFAFAGITNKVVFLPDESFAIVQKHHIELYDFAGNSLPLVVQETDVSWIDDEKKGHEHFMLKEIYEQKNAIHATISSLNTNNDQIWDQLGVSAYDIQNLKTLYLIGCGSSWNAARIAQFYFEKVCMLPTRVMLASEFRYMPFFPDEHSLYIAISQSGETADTLEAVRLINKLQLPTVALTNVASSTMTREAHGFLLTHAGFEVAVASTKAFTTQVSALFWLAHRIALEKGIITKRQMEEASDDVMIAAEVLENTIEKYKYLIIHELADRYSQYKRFIFLGRNISYPFALEASLKLKEISYIFAQCYPAGELKHGPIALIDQETPVVLFSTLDSLIYQKLLSNAQEVKARQGHLIVFAYEGQSELCSLANQAFIIPTVNPLLGPLAMTGLMQFFIYQIAKVLNCPIDKPRNLAKSVTVE